MNTVLFPDLQVLIRRPHLGTDITGLLALSVPSIGMVTTSDHLGEVQGLRTKVLIRMPHLGSDITGLLALLVPRIGMVTTYLHINLGKVHGLGVQSPHWHATSGIRHHRPFGIVCSQNWHVPNNLPINSRNKKAITGNNFGGILQLSNQTVL